MNVTNLPPSTYLSSAPSSLYCNCFLICPDDQIVRLDLRAGTFSHLVSGVHGTRTTNVL